MTSTFSYAGRFSKDSVDTEVIHPTHAKYDFAVAYPPPETAPLNELVEGLIAGLGISLSGNSLPKSWKLTEDSRSIPKIFSSAPALVRRTTA